MLKRIVLVVSILVLAWTLNATDMLRKVLQNGMEVIVRRDTTSQSVGMICVIKTGSMHEGKLMGSGISHYLEHVVSGGSTTLHPESYYSNKDKEIGAVTNAFTSFDKTAYHTLVKKESFSIALQMLAEHIQFCSFDPVEVAREQQVIAKEIIMGSTPPYSQMYWRYHSILYDGTNKKSPVIGNADLFMKLERSDLVEYYNRRYVPNNMIFIVNGNVEIQQAMKEIDTVFAGFQRRPLEPVHLPGPTITMGSLNHREEFDIKLPIVYISQVIPASGLQDYYAIDAMTDILINRQYSPIQRKLYEELQLVNYLFAYVSIDHSSNTLSLNIGFEAKETANIQKTIDLFYSELSKYQRGYFKQKQLDRLIHRYEAEHLLETKNVQDVFTEMCDNMIDYGVPDNYSSMLENLKRVTPSDLNAMVKKYFNPANKLTFCAIPKGEMGLLTGVSEKPVVTTELKKIIMDNGLTLVHKQSSVSPIVRGTIIIPVSSDYETGDNKGYIEFMCDMLLKGSKKYSLEKITSWTEDNAADIRISNSRDAVALSFSCLNSDLPEMQKIIVDAVTNPLFSESEIKLLKEAYNASALRDMSNPREVHSDFRSKMIYLNRREQMNTSERNEIIQKITRKDVIDTYAKYFKAPKAVISIVGDMAESEAKVFAKGVYRAFNYNRIDAQAQPLAVEVTNATYSQEYPFEQVNIDINMKAPSCLDPDYAVMKVIENVLSGSHGRIHQATRGDNDLSYFAHAMFASEPSFGYFRVTSQTSEEKAQQLKQALLSVLDRMMNEPVTEEELSRAIEAENIQLNNLITDKEIGYISAANEFKGLGYDYWLKEIQELRKVSPEDVQRVAKKYLKDRDVIISVPSKDVNKMVGD